MLSTHDLDDIPMVPCSISPDGIHWVIARCPFCGQRHIHGAAAPAGHLVAHCPPGTPGSDRGYILKEKT